MGTVKDTMSPNNKFDEVLSCISRRISTHFCLTFAPYNIGITICFEPYFFAVGVSSKCDAPNQYFKSNILHIIHFTFFHIMLSSSKANI